MSDIVRFFKYLLGLDSSNEPSDSVPGIALWDSILDIAGEDEAEVREAVRILNGKVRYVWGGPTLKNEKGEWVSDIETIEDGNIFNLLPISSENSERKGGDCSGVTQTILRYAKLIPKGIGRLTAASMQSRFTPIQESEVRVGDCVFYGSPATHVVVSVGRDSDGKILVGSMSGDSSFYGQDPTKTMYVRASDYKTPSSFGRPK